MIDILKRIGAVLDGRSLYSRHEQLLADARHEIAELRLSKHKAIEDAAKIVENFDIENKTVVGRMRLAQRKAAIAAEIRKLKN
jgi:uncharacterized protein YwgA